MGTNSSQWPPYPSYMDCSQRLCSMYCPQWCYIFPPPPQFDLTDDDGHSSSLAKDLSPLIIAVIGVLATAFLLITYLTFISKHCRNGGGRDRNSVSPEFDDPNRMSFESSQQRAASGLDEAVIKSIAVCRYKKGDGFVDGTECSVCLGEFQDDESLRLLPKCSHAFHIPCIDTWLQSHATCPLCRCSIPPVIGPPQPTNPRPEPATSAAPPRHVRHDTVLEVQDLEAIARQEAQIRINADECVVLVQPQPMRRSVSLGSGPCQDRVSIADILSNGQEQVASPENAAGPDPSKEFLGQNPDVLLTRSVSTGRAMLLSKCKHGHGEKDSSTAPS